MNRSRREIREGEIFTMDSPYAKEETQEKRTIEGMRLLMAEDNEINAEISISILEEMGASVEHAQNGQEAVDMFKSHEPGYYDTILMDIQMPVMNGWEATATIRTLEREDAGEIPIYALSADALLRIKDVLWKSA